MSDKTQLLKAIASLAPDISSGLIVFDATGTIIHASKMKKWLGVESENLAGKAITAVFPGVDASIPSGSHTVDCNSKSPTFRRLEINIFKINGEANLNVIVVPFGGENLQLADIETRATNLTKKVRQKVAAKVAASGGLIGFCAWMLTQITPLGAALQGAIAAWQWQGENPGQKLENKNVVLSQKIDADSLAANLKKVSQEFAATDRTVIAVAYYKLIKNEFGTASIDYRADSESVGDEQVFFDDQRLNEEEYRRLKFHECVTRQKLGRMIDRPSAPNFGGILCPTIRLVKQPGGLSEIAVANVSAIAFEPGTAIQLEPNATRLWRYSANFENLIDH
jgi:hypothetical protein